MDSDPRVAFLRAHVTVGLNSTDDVFDAALQDEEVQKNVSNFLEGGRPGGTA